MLAILVLYSVIYFAGAYISTGRLTKNLLSPPILAALFFFITFILRGLYIETRGDNYVNQGLYWRIPYDDVSMFISQTLGLVFFLLFCISYKFTHAVRNEINNIWKNAIKRIHFNMAKATTIICLIFLANILLLISSAGGINQFAFEIASRHSFFEGKGLQFALLFTPSVFLLVCIAAPPSRWKRLNVSILILVSVASTLATGTRAALLFSLILPTIVYFWLDNKREIRLWHFITIVGCVVLFVFYRVAIRDAEGLDNVDALLNSNLLIEELINSPDTQLLDSVIVITENETIFAPSRFLASTLRGISTYIPIDNLLNLQIERGSIYYTKKYFPQFHATGGAGITPTLIGDLLMDTGILGVLIAPIIFGSLLKRCYAGATRGGDKSLLILYSYVSFQFVMILRVDIQQIATSVFPLLVVLAFGFAFKLKLKGVA